MARKEKVLVVSTTPFFGGGEAFIVNTLSKINRDIYYLVRCNELLNFLPSSKVKSLASDSLVGQIKEVNRYAKEIQADCVLLNGGSSIYFTPFIGCRSKIIYRHTTNYSVSNIFKRFLYIFLLHVCYAFANCIVHVSAFSLGEQKLFLRKACYIHHGVKMDIPYHKKPGEGPVRFLFVGRTEAAKGIHLIVDAFKKLPEGMAILNIVGRGELDSFLLKNISSSITYYGFRKDVDQYYNNSDVFISLPIHEAFGLTFIEAMRHSLPIIACDTGGISEIVQNEVNGLLVSRDSESVYKAMLQMCTNKRLITILGEKGYQIGCKKFTIDKVISSIEEIL
jgi:candidate alpha-glycosyltransferase; glycosyltransferase family 4